MVSYQRLHAEALLVLLALAVTPALGEANNDTGVDHERRFDGFHGEGATQVPADHGYYGGYRHMKCKTHFPADIWKTREYKQPCGLDTTSTCPCPDPLYREFNGMCNNPKTITLGSASIPYNRFLKARYADGVDEVILKTHKGHLPMAREISVALFKDKDRPDHVNSIMLMQWGQLIAHDVGHTEDQTNGDGSAIDCCEKKPGGGGRGRRRRGLEDEDSSSYYGSSSSSSEEHEDDQHGSHEHDTHKSQEHGDHKCLPISIHDDDPFYSMFHRRCMNFVRSKSLVCPNTGGVGLLMRQRRSAEGRDPRGEQKKPNPKSANQLNQVTSFLDLSIVYGSSNEVNQKLRLGSNGLMKTREVQVKKKLYSSEEDEEREFLPMSLSTIDDCDPNDNICYLAGDDRVNTHVWLASMQVVLVREHNRIARRLQDIHPDWDDERVFQETRRIMIAIWQLISYRDYLPKIVGTYEVTRPRAPSGDHDADTKSKKVLKRLEMEMDEHSRGKYSNKINPSTLNEFSTAAFRYLHSLIQGNIEFHGDGRCPMKKHRVRDHFNDPSVLEEDDNLEKIVRGMTHQPSQQADQYFTTEMTRFLFRGKKSFGDDLVSFDIQRGRDHGIPSYNDVREICGQPRAVDFDDFNNVMSEKTIRLLKKLYRSPNDVDFFVGGSFERHCVDGDDWAIVGPTFGCVIAEQFYRWRKGDRYFFDHEDGPGKFTKEQYEAIHGVSLASILCQDLHEEKYMQPDPFLQISRRNELRKCNDIPKLDLKPWKDFHPSGNCN